MRMPLPPRASGLRSSHSPDDIRERSRTRVPRRRAWQLPRRMWPGWRGRREGPATVTVRNDTTCATPDAGTVPKGKDGRTGRAPSVHRRGGSTRPPSQVRRAPGSSRDIRARSRDAPRVRTARERIVVLLTNMAPDQPAANQCHGRGDADVRVRRAAGAPVRLGSRVATQQERSRASGQGRLWDALMTLTNARGRESNVIRSCARLAIA